MVKMLPLPLLIAVLPGFVVVLETEVEESTKIRTCKEKTSINNNKDFENGNPPCVEHSFSTKLFRTS